MGVLSPSSSRQFFYLRSLLLFLIFFCCLASSTTTGIQSYSTTSLIGNNGDNNIKEFSSYSPDVSSENKIKLNNKRHGIFSTLLRGHANSVSSTADLLWDGGGGGGGVDGDYFSEGIYTTDKSETTNPSNNHRSSNSGYGPSIRRRLDGLSAIIPREWQITLAVVLSLLSSLSSGLTLGLMTLDVVQLEVLANGRPPVNAQIDKKMEKEAAMARRVLSVRRDGNLVLVSLLLLNVSVNSAFSILSSELTSGLVGLLVSTSVITLFGEILPQAICAKYGLQAGYYLYPCVIITEFILYFIAKPTALLLDKLLGRDIGTSYSKEQLKALVEHHEKQLNVLRHEEMQIVSGGLDVGKKQVGDAMTPISDVFGVNVNAVLNFDTAAEVILSGYSRVPVFDYDRPDIIVGVFHAKDIALIDPNENLPLSSVMALYGRCTYAVDIDMSLLDLLREFKTGRSHLAVVREAVQNIENKDPFYKHVGIITLEDVLEEILQDEIYDEYEQKGPARTSSRISSVAARNFNNDRSVCSTSFARRERGGAGVTNTGESGAVAILLPPTPTTGEIHPTPATATLASRLKSDQAGVVRSAAGAAAAAAAAEFGRAQRSQVTHAPDSRPETPRSPIHTTVTVAVVPSVNLTRASDDEQIEPQILLQGKSTVTPLPSPINNPSTITQQPLLSLPPFSLQVPLQCKSLQPCGIDQSALSGGMRSCVSSSYQGDSAWSEAPPSSRINGNDCSSGLKKRSGGAAAGRLRLLNRQRHGSFSLSKNEVQAVSMFLAHTLNALQLPYITPSALNRLVVDASVVSPPAKTPVFERGEPCAHMALVLQGKLKLSIGKSESIECSLGPWTVLGSPVFGPLDLTKLKLDITTTTQEVAEIEVARQVEEQLMEPFVPEYTACVVGDNRPCSRASTSASSNANFTPVRLLLITRKNYVKAVTTPLAAHLLEQLRASKALAHRSNASLTTVAAGGPGGPFSDD